MNKKTPKKCCIISSSSLAIELAQTLRCHSFEIVTLFTDDFAVLNWARSKKIKTLPLKEILIQNKETLKIDYLFSVFNPILLPPATIKLAKTLSINYHNSLLPHYRGYNAPTWAILNKEKHHGFTWHIINEKIDRGSILLQEKVPISSKDTATTLNLKCYQLAIKCLPHLLDMLIAGNIKANKQPSDQGKYFKKHDTLTNEGIIEWNWEADEIYRLYRGLSFSNFENSMTTPKCKIKDKLFIINKMSISPENARLPPGHIVEIFHDKIILSTASNNIILESISELDGSLVSLKELSKKLELSANKNINETHQPISLQEGLKKITKENEAFWYKELQQITPGVLPCISVHWVANRDQYEPVSKKNVTLNGQLLTAKKNNAIDHPKFSVAALTISLIYLYKANNYKDLTVFYLIPTCKNLHSELHSNCVPITTNFSPKDNFYTALEKVIRKINLLTKHKSFTKDILIRYNQLKEIDLTQFACISERPTKDTYPKRHPIHIEILSKKNSIHIHTHDEISHNSSDPNNASIISNHLKALYEDILSSPSKPLKDFAIRDQEQEIEFSLNLGVGERREYKKSLLAQFIYNARKYPNKTAIIDAETNLKITYSNLNKISSKIAQLFVKKYNPDHYIGILMESKIEFVVCMLSVLKIGRAYIPMSLDDPLSFLQEIITNSNIKYILMEKDKKEKYADFFHSLGVSIILYHELKHDSEKTEIIDNLPKNSLNEDLYVMYTSGSTGKPKGVIIKQKGVMRLVKNSNYVKINSDDCIAQTSSFCFDASTFTIWGALLNSATLILFSKNTVIDSNALKEAIKKYKINIMWLTARLLDAHVDKNIAMFSYLKYVIAGGDSLSVNTINKLSDFLKNKPCQIINGYGPTENTTFTTTYCIDKNKKYTESIPIGKPITNTSVYVLDKFSNVCPIGIQGELYITGDGLSSGYLQQKEKTNEKFCYHTVRINNKSLKKIFLYQAGDYVRWRSNKNLDFYGRKDGLIKVRGFRIEKDALIRHLNSLSFIKQSEVLVDKESASEALIAFALTSSTDPNEKIALDEIAQKVPFYMVPSRIIFLSFFPLTRNGKIDTKELLAIYKSQAKKNPVSLSSNSIMRTLQLIWSDLLHTPITDMNSDFLALGGNSLSVITMLNFIHCKFDKQIDVSQFLEEPTLNNLYKLITTYQVKIKEKDPARIIDDIKYYGSKIKILEHHNSEKTAIFLTGCTGFLGKYVLDYLLKNTALTVYCLVRNIEAIKNELRDPTQYDSSEYSVYLANCRLIFIQGDLSKDNLGITPVLYEKIAKKTYAIYHIAAYINHVFPYSALKQVNVKGTFEIIKLSNTTVRKKIFFVSALSAAKKDNPNSPAFEELPKNLDEIKYISDGYSQTKWASEFLLKLAHEKGLETAVIRPGWILGDSKGGHAPHTNHLLCLLKACIQLKVAPNWECNLHFLPVDFVAAAIVNISLSDRGSNTVFNLTNLNHISWKNLINLTKQRGYEINCIPVEEWVNKYIKYIDESNALFPFKNLYMDINSARNYGPDMTANSEQKNTLSIIYGKNILMPKITNKLIASYLTFLEDSGFLDPSLRQIEETQQHTAHGINHLPPGKHHDQKFKTKKLGSIIN